MALQMLYGRIQRNGNGYLQKEEGTGIPPHFLQKKLNYPLHNRLPVFFDCHSKNSLSNELKHFPNRRCDFSLLGSLSAVTKLPKAFL